MGSWFSRRVCKEEFNPARLKNGSALRQRAEILMSCIAKVGNTETGNRGLSHSAKMQGCASKSSVEINGRRSIAEPTEAEEKDS
jgi:hypothetical protein